MTDQQLVNLVYGVDLGTLPSTKDPRSLPESAAVYFLYTDCLDYIGRARNLRKRFRFHQRFNVIKNELTAIRYWMINETIDAVKAEHMMIILHEPLYGPNWSGEGFVRDYLKRLLDVAVKGAK